MTLSSQNSIQNKPTAALYVRVSTEEQAKHGYSLAAQEETLTNYCRALGYEVYKIYKDEGRSAKDMKNRPAMQELLKEAEQKKFAAIFIYKLDRFSRSLKDLILTIDRIKAWGIDFVSLQDRIETTSASGKLMFHIISAFAEFERNVIGERTKFGMDKKARDGSFVSKAPLGYKFVNKTLVVDHESSKKVLAIFKEFLETDISLSKIAEKSGLTTSGVIKLLSNKTYLGVVKFGGEYKGLHQPLIDKNIFNAVQNKLKHKTISVKLHDIFKSRHINWRWGVLLLDALHYEAIEPSFIDVPELEPGDDEIIRVCSGRDTSEEHTKIKARAYKLFKNLGYNKEIKPEYKVGDKYADIALDNEKGLIAVECGECNPDKVFYYLDLNATTIVIPYSSDVGYIYSKTKNYDTYIKGRFISLKNKMDIIEKDTFLDERSNREKACKLLGISEQHYENIYGFWSK